MCVKKFFGVIIGCKLYFQYVRSCPVYVFFFFFFFFFKVHPNFCWSALDPEHLCGDRVLFIFSHEPHSDANHLLLHTQELFCPLIETFVSRCCGLGICVGVI